MARRRDKGSEKRIARERVHQLLDSALAETRQGNTELADRYSRRVRRITMRYQTGLPPRAKLHTCRDCNAFLMPGITSRVRIHTKRLITTCLACGHIRRRPLEPRA